MVLKKKSILLIMVFLIGGFVCACGKEDSVAGETFVEDTEEVSSTEETRSAEEEAAEQWEKGYGLPVDEQEEKEVENDCNRPKHSVDKRFQAVKTFSLCQLHSLITYGTVWYAIHKTDLIHSTS